MFWANPRRQQIRATLTTTYLVDGFIAISNMYSDYGTILLQGLKMPEREDTPEVRKEGSSSASIGKLQRRADYADRSNVVRVQDFVA